ncbi:MAG: glycerophosphodiester phosphodiesterase family protein [Acidimicrobiales bacterium]
MGMRATRWMAALVGGALLLAATGCSGDDDGSGTAEPDRTTTTETPPAEPAADFRDAAVVVIAHRGASADAPEHTFAAYDLALEQGADYLEQDLQLTEDGMLVVLHDPYLDRTARGPEAQCTGPVAEHPASDLASCEVGSWFATRFTGEVIPTFAEVLDRYAGRASLYVEVKSPAEQPGIEDALLELLDAADLPVVDPTLPPVVVQSFSGESLRSIHASHPDLPLVQLIPAEAGAPTPDALDEIATYAVAIGPAKALVTEELVAAAHGRCLDVHPYTVEDPDEMASLLDLGVGGMFANSPATLREVAADRDPPLRCVTEG